MPLTVTWLNSVINKPREKILRKSDSGGLSARVTLLGKVVFTFRYRFNNKQTSIDLGVYPAMSLIEARACAFNLQTKLNAGEDPGKSKLKVDENAPLTIQTVCERWCRDYVEVRRKDGAPAILKQFQLHLFPQYGHLPINGLTMKGCFQILRELADTKSTSRFIALLQNMKQAFRYGVKFYNMDTNPLSEISIRDFGKQVNFKDRILNEEELHLCLKAMESGHFSIEHQCVFYIILHTGCRQSEITQARTGDFNLEQRQWTVPRELSKNGVAFSRPIHEKTLPYIKTLMSFSGNSEFLLPRPDRKAPVAINWGCYVPKKMIRYYATNNAMQDWSLHDLRRTARTAWSKWTQNHIAELMLGHKFSGVHAVYDRYKYMNEMLETYQNWIEYLEGLKNKGA